MNTLQLTQDGCLSEIATDTLLSFSLSPFYWMLSAFSSASAVVYTKLKGYRGWFLPPPTPPSLQSKFYVWLLNFKFMGNNLKQ